MPRVERGTVVVVYESFYKGFVGGRQRAGSIDVVVSLVREWWWRQKVRGAHCRPHPVPLLSATRRYGRDWWVVILVQPWKSKQRMNKSQYFALEIKDDNLVAQENC